MNVPALGLALVLASALLSGCEDTDPRPGEPGRMDSGLRMPSTDAALDAPHTDASDTDAGDTDAGDTDAS